jgi:hypothetical protein
MKSPQKRKHLFKNPPRRESHASKGQHRNGGPKTEGENRITSGITREATVEADY